MKPQRFKRLNPDTVVLLKQIFSGVAVLTVVGLLITIVWYGTRIQSLTIKTVTASGGQTIDVTKVEEIARRQLEGTYIGLIPRTFAWLYPSSDIEQSLQQSDRIHNIVIERNGGTKLSITFDEYIPHALWCSAVDRHHCAFIDSAGYAFAPAPDLTGGSFVRFVQIGGDYTLDDYVLGTQEFEQLVKTIELLATDGWFISHVEVDQAGDAFLGIVNGGELKITLSQTPEETVDNLRTVLTAEKFTHIKPGNFQYIDLRFGNKVFVNEEEKIATSSVEVASSTDSGDEEQE